MNVCKVMNMIMLDLQLCYECPCSDNMTHLQKQICLTLALFEQHSP